jgi:hypothetical protein
MFKLLSSAITNAKTSKGDLDKYEAAILYLAPSTVSGRNVCPNASAGCASACLFTAGRGRFTNVYAARLRKTNLFWDDRALFQEWLMYDLTRLDRIATRKNKKAVVRLNGTSDITWPFSLYEAFPNIQFYDYTKDINRVKRLTKLQAEGRCLNYHLTFSLSEINYDQALYALALGANVAVVFRDTLPTRFMDRPVVSGDEHDFRFLDGKQIDGRGLVIGLKAKGRAKEDKSGFVMDASK